MDEVSTKVLDIAEKYLGEFKISNGQVVAKYCPFCHGGAHYDRHTFYVGLHNGAYYCQRGSCNEKGSIADLCRHFGEQYTVRSYEPAKLTNQKKKYALPNADDIKPLTEEAMTYLATRRISEKTLNDWKIGCDDKGNIVFPFYRDNVLTYVKYREPKKYTKESKGAKEWQMANTEPILFGMDMVDTKKPLFITEGEIDALSLYEAGVTNVVSVPCGCKNLDWIQLCWNWLENFQQIVLFGDNDEPGLSMIHTLAKRLGEDRCLIPNDYPDCIVDGESIGRLCKDANEILYCHGPEALQQLANSCEQAPIQGVIDVGSIQYVDPTTIPRIFTRIPELDDAIGGLGEGGITILSGKRGEGKSTLTGKFVNEAIDQGKNVCLYSGELSAAKVFEWLCGQAVEARYITTKVDDRNGKVYTYVPTEIQDRIREWYSGHCFLYDNNWLAEDDQTDSILRIFQVCAKRYGCSLFLVD